MRDQAIRDQALRDQATKRHLRMQFGSSGKTVAPIWRASPAMILAGGICTSACPSVHTSISM
jgi:hypothetical protein